MQIMTSITKYGEGSKNTDFHMGLKLLSPKIDL